MGEGFATWIRDKFTPDNEDGVLDPKTGRKVITIINARDGMSKVYGLSFEARLAYQRLFDLQGGVTLQRSLYGQEKVLFDADDETPRRPRSRRVTMSARQISTATSPLRFILPRRLALSSRVPIPAR